jgi:hypothetical protein
MAYTFYKRNVDNTFYAMEADTKSFKVVSDPDSTQGSVMCSVLTGNIAELNIIQINSQISSNPTAFTTIQEIDFNNRIFAIKGYLEENL